MRHFIRVTGYFPKLNPRVAAIKRAVNNPDSTIGSKHYISRIPIPVEKCCRTVIPDCAKSMVQESPRSTICAQCACFGFLQTKNAHYPYARASIIALIPMILATRRILYARNVSAVSPDTFSSPRHKYWSNPHILLIPPNGGSDSS